MHTLAKNIFSKLCKESLIQDGGGILADVTRSELNSPSTQISDWMTEWSLMPVLLYLKAF